MRRARRMRAQGRREDGAGRWYVSIRAFRTTSEAYAIQHRAAGRSSRPTGGVGYLCGGRVMAGGASCHDTASRLRGEKLPGQYLRTPDEYQTGIWTGERLQGAFGGGGLWRGRRGCSREARRTCVLGRNLAIYALNDHYISPAQRYTTERMSAFAARDAYMHIARALRGARTHLRAHSCTRLAPTPPPCLRLPASAWRAHQRRFPSVYGLWCCQIVSFS